MFLKRFILFDDVDDGDDSGDDGGDDDGDDDDDTDEDDAESPIQVYIESAQKLNKEKDALTARFSV